MKELFRPWRRRFGVLTLLIACGFAVAWIRSGWNADGIWYPSDTSNYFAESLHGVIRLYRATPDNATPGFRGRRFSFVSENARSAPYLKFDDNGEPLPFNPWEKLEVISRSDWLGFSFGTAKIMNTNTKVEMCIIPYWPLVIPLTLISVLLLLLKSRNSTSKKITESVSERMK